VPTRIIFGPSRPVDQARAGDTSDGITVTQDLDYVAGALGGTALAELDQQWGQATRKVFVNPAAVRFIVEA
jgi:hypothetical protein